jgi:hypothetical protein
MPLLAKHIMIGFLESEIAFLLYFRLIAKFLPWFFRIFIFLLCFLV